MILTPSMILVWILGLALAANAGMFSGAAGLGWLHAKFLFVVILSGYHGWAVGYAKKLAAGKPTLTGKQLRMLNEVPAILIAVIVVLVIVRPFSRRIDIRDRGPWELHGPRRGAEHAEIMLGRFTALQLRLHRGRSSPRARASARTSLAASGGWYEC